MLCQSSENITLPGEMSGLALGSKEIICKLLGYPTWWKYFYLPGDFGYTKCYKNVIHGGDFGSHGMSSSSGVMLRPAGEHSAVSVWLSPSNDSGHPAPVSLLVGDVHCHTSLLEQLVLSTIRWVETIGSSIGGGLELLDVFLCLVDLHLYPFSVINQNWKRNSGNSVSSVSP